MGAAGLAFALAFAGSSAAADGVSFAVSPSRLILVAEAGETSAGVVTVYNQTGDPLELDIGIGDFLLDDTRSAASTFAVVDWVRTDLKRLRLEPRAQADLRVIVDVPLGAAPGGYQVGLFLVSAPRSAGEVAVSGRLGAAVLIELAPEDRPLRRELQVTGHELTAEFPDELSLDALFGPRSRAETQVANVGETFVRAVAVDRYRSWMAEDAIERTAPGTAVLRAATGTFTTDGPTMPWIGPATVTTEIVYERGAQDYATIVVQTGTFVVPWRLIGVLVAGVIAVIVARRSRRRAAR